MKTVKTEQSLAAVPRRLEVLKGKSFKLLAATKARAMDVMELSAVKVEALKVKGLESLTELRRRATELREEATKRLADATAAAQSSYGQLRKDGLRSWAQQNAELIRKYVTLSVASIDSRARSLVREAQQKVLAMLTERRAALASRVEAAKSKARASLENVKVKASEAKSKATAFAQDGHVRATAVGVTGGVATLGTTGAATGLCAGAAVGAAVGVVPALFTFGLSIPLGAVLGGGAGLFMGTAVGATAGAFTGGAAGYGAYAKRGEIQELRSKTVSRISSGVDLVKGKAVASRDFIKDKASAARARVVGSA